MIAISDGRYVGSEACKWSVYKNPMIWFAEVDFCLIF